MSASLFPVTDVFRPLDGKSRARSYTLQYTDWLASRYAPARIVQPAALHMDTGLVWGTHRLELGCPLA